MRSLIALVSIPCLVSAVILAAAAYVQAGETTGKVRHVVLFKFKDGTSAADIQKIEEAFQALPKKIPGIAAFEWGTNISPENKAEGFTHCFFLTFNSIQARDAYLPHPEHKAFGNLLHPHLDKVLVIDYVAKE